MASKCGGRGFQRERRLVKCTILGSFLLEPLVNTHTVYVRNRRSQEKAASERHRIVVLFGGE